MNAPSDTGTPDGVRLLTDEAVIVVDGADAATFLHGQLTNDVQKLGPTQARWAAYCSAQGRMLGSFVVASAPSSATGGRCFWLVGSADLQTGVLDRLRKFVMRAKVNLTPGEPGLRVVGALGASAARLLGEQATATPASGPALAVWQQMQGEDGGVAVRLPDDGLRLRALWIGPASAAETLCRSAPVLDAEAWAWAAVASGVAPVTGPTSGAFVPQMLNYELTGGVDFRKGCYPGQEVVARSQYLGKLKRRAFRLEGSGPGELRPGQEIFWSGDPDQPAGQVALAARRPGAEDAFALLAELKVAATEQGELHLGSLGGPRLMLAELPYTVSPPETSVRPQ